MAISPWPMEDENALGILVAFHSIEDEEYASNELDSFEDRYLLFQRLVLQYFAENPPGTGCRGLELGHSLYLELPEEHVGPGLLKWVKTLREALAEQNFENTVIVAHGGRWVEDSTTVQLNRAGDIPIASLGGPSEPLRRALFAETATHGAPSEDTAWGAGFYLDSEAMEALGIRPKNEPTLLEIAGADFVRVSR